MKKIKLFLAVVFLAAAASMTPAAKADDSGDGCVFTYCDNDTCNQACSSWGYIGGGTCHIINPFGGVCSYASCDCTDFIIGG